MCALFKKMKTGQRALGPRLRWYLITFFVPGSLDCWASPKSHLTYWKIYYMLFQAWITLCMLIARKCEMSNWATEIVTTLNPCLKTSWPIHNIPDLWETLSIQAMAEENQFSTNTIPNQDDCRSWFISVKKNYCKIRIQIKMEENHNYSWLYLLASLLLLLLSNSFFFAYHCFLRNIILTLILPESHLLM